METRILEFVDGNGSRHYRIQYKWLWFWIYFKKNLWLWGENDSPIEFNNYEDARKYIEDKLYEIRKRARRFKGYRDE